MFLWFKDTLKSANLDIGLTELFFCPGTTLPFGDTREIEIWDWRCYPYVQSLQETKKSWTLRSVSAAMYA